MDNLHDMCQVPSQRVPPDRGQSLESLMSSPNISQESKPAWFRHEDLFKSTPCNNHLKGLELNQVKNCQAGCQMFGKAAEVKSFYITKKKKKLSTLLDSRPTSISVVFTEVPFTSLVRNLDFSERLVLFLH